MMLVLLAAASAAAVAACPSPCPPCAPSPLKELACRAARLDSCECCTVCRREASEPCGGVLEEFGRCEDGLVCVTGKGETQGLCVESGVVVGCASGVVVEKACRAAPEAGCVCETTISCLDGLETEPKPPPTPTAASADWPDEESCLRHLQSSQEMGRRSCQDVACPVEFQPSCPSDAFLLASKPTPPDCCEKIGKCICHQKKCQEEIPECAEGWELRRIKEAAKVPGDCCDLYACQEKKVDCSHRHCSRLAERECPVDSERPPPLIPPAQCCPVQRPCQCLGGICSVAPSCPPSTSRVQARAGDGTPGNCCDSFKCVGEPGAPPNSSFLDTLLGGGEMGTRAKTCAHGNKIYADGQRWNTDECTQCECRNELTFCHKMTCASMPDTCSWVDVPEGECCPLCMGCITEGGKKVNLTDTWSPDDCTSCSCGPNGKLLCQTQTCTTNCDNPRDVPGTCCPVCDDPTVVQPGSVCPRLEHCPLRCELGLQRDASGCFVCACDEPIGAAAAPCDTTEDCDLECPLGRARDSATGCELCRCDHCPPLHACYRHCLYGFQRDDAGCPVCHCNERELDQPRPEATEGGCPASATDEARQSGEWWTSGCRHCYCEDGQRFCSLVSCPELESCPPGAPILPPRPEKGECCRRCGPAPAPRPLLHAHTVCHAPGTGRLFLDGQSWELHPCVSCTCRVGHVLCHPKPCPPAACENPVRDGPLDCCPRCPEEPVPANATEAVCTDELGQGRAAASAWRQGDCDSCRCGNNGSAECFSEACPDLSTCSGPPLRLAGRCCPLCTDALGGGDDVCAINGRLRRRGEAWTDGACRNCTCESGGQTQCDEEVCPPCVPPALRVAPGPGQPCCLPCREPAPGSESLSLALVFASAGLAIGLIVAILALAWLWRRRPGPEELKKKAPLISHTPQLPSAALADPSGGFLLSRSSSKSKPQRKQASKSRLGEEPTEALLATSDSGSSTSCTSGSTHGGGGTYQKRAPPYVSAPAPPCATRAASFNLRSGVQAPWGSGPRPRSCNVDM